MNVRYDAVGDILYVDLVPPYVEQESDMIGDTVVARSNPASGRVENLEIFSFLATLRAGPLVLPVDIELKVAAGPRARGRPTSRRAQGPVARAIEGQRGP